MPKLSQYVAMAVAEYLAETGSPEPDACWTAEFYQDSGVQDDYPEVGLVAFAALVEKALAKEAERAAKEARGHLDKLIEATKRQRKP
jgi:hypothetical protein